mmetsp:Transcript_12029/g.31587  ORF Transcript_12029/g.31587 Transcript_12029/m.31587 type:complete len:202 (-) Transcript_12029:339-944(-)
MRRGGAVKTESVPYAWQRTRSVRCSSAWIRGSVIGSARRSRRSACARLRGLTSSRWCSGSGRARRHGIARPRTASGRTVITTETSSSKPSETIRTTAWSGCRAAQSTRCVICRRPTERPAPRVKAQHSTLKTHLGGCGVSGVWSSRADKQPPLCSSVCARQSTRSRSLTRSCEPRFASQLAGRHHSLRIGSTPHLGRCRAA